MGFMPALAKFIDFQDPEECARVRAITKEEITEHPNPDFQIRVVEDLTQFYATFAHSAGARREPRVRADPPRGAGPPVRDSGGHSQRPGD